MSIIEAAAGHARLARELPPGLNLDRIEQATRDAPDPYVLGSAVYVYLAQQHRERTGCSCVGDDCWFLNVTTEQFLAAIEIVKKQLATH